MSTSDTTISEASKYTAARLLVGLATELKVRDIVMKMLLKDVVNVEKFVYDLKNEFHLL